MCAFMYFQSTSSFFFVECFIFAGLLGNTPSRRDPHEHNKAHTGRPGHHPAKYTQIVLNSVLGNPINVANVVVVVLPLKLETLR